MKRPYVKPAIRGEYPLDAALAENAREIADIAKECGASQVYALRMLGPWGTLFEVGDQFIPLSLDDYGLVLICCFPASDGGNPGVETIGGAA